MSIADMLPGIKEGQQKNVKERSILGYFYGRH
jgi:hypothetical protein